MRVVIPNINENESSVSGKDAKLQTVKSRKLMYQSLLVMLLVLNWGNMVFNPFFCKIILCIYDAIKKNI